MKYALLDINGIVVQVQLSQQDGFIEVEDSICCGMKKEGNVFVIVEPTKTEKELRDEKLLLFHTAWNNLKIGYNSTLKEAFEIKYGSELGVGYENTILYNCNTFLPVESTDHLYNCSEENIDLLDKKRGAEYSASDGKNWYGSLGIYPLDSIELGIILLKADEQVQKLADLILGAQ